MTPQEAVAAYRAVSAELHKDLVGLAATRAQQRFRVASGDLLAAAVELLEQHVAGAKGARLAARADSESIRDAAAAALAEAKAAAGVAQSMRLLALSLAVFSAIYTGVAILRVVGVIH
ncbi:MAG TPA: hypothetical protein PK948_04980 [Gemmatimonadales bacterium]|nr:hypothetical protein [Gemmatimonadales bacterium]